MKEPLEITHSSTSKIYAFVQNSAAEDKFLKQVTKTTSVDMECSRYFKSESFREPFMRQNFLPNDISLQICVFNFYGKLCFLFLNDRRFKITHSNIEFNLETASVSHSKQNIKESGLAPILPVKCVYNLKSFTITRSNNARGKEKSQNKQLLCMRCLFFR